MAVEIVSFKEHVSNTLRGFADVRMTNIGLTMKAIGVHQKNGSRWVTMPSKAYAKKDGSQGYEPIVEFYDKSMEGQFRRAFFDAFDKYRAGDGTEGEIPF